jgi:hypothetical protein
MTQRISPSRRCVECGAVWARWGNAPAARCLRLVQSLACDIMGPQGILQAVHAEARIDSRRVLTGSAGFFSASRFWGPLSSDDPGQFRPRHRRQTVIRRASLAPCEPPVETLRVSGEPRSAKWIRPQGPAAVADGKAPAIRPTRGPMPEIWNPFHSREWSTAATSQHGTAPR